MTDIAYNIHDYDVPLTTVDIAIFTVLYGRLHALLVKRAGEECDPHNGKWSLPGGFIDLGRDVDLEEAAKRKLQEKTGVKAPYLEQVGTVGNGCRDWRGWSVTVVYFALLPSDQVRLHAGKGADDVRWFPVADGGGMGALAFDHGELIAMANERLREKVKYTTLPVLLMPREFALPELQLVYESILGVKMDAKSFRRRIMSADILDETPSGARQSGQGRPAQLYRARSLEPHYFMRNISGSRESC